MNLKLWIEMVIRLVVFLFFIKLSLFINTSTLACGDEVKKPKLTLAESEQLLTDVKYLLSDKEAIDYDDPKLNDILNKYANKYNLFTIYKTFIEFEKSNKTKEDIKRVKEVLSGIYYQGPGCCFYGLKADSANEVTAALLSMMAVKENYYDLEEVINEELSDDIRTYVAIPLWLVLKHPSILNYSYNRWSLGVNANYSVRNLPSFKTLDKHYTEITGNYWYHYKGYLSLDKLSGLYDMESIISFAPGLIRSIFNEDGQRTGLQTEFNLGLELWSYEGIWNRLKYQQLLKDLDSASDELSLYYLNNYGLAKYAQYSKLVLSYYVSASGGDMESNPPEESLWYPDFLHYYKIIEKLETFRDNIRPLKNYIIKNNFSKKEKGFVLFYSILKNYDISFIKWLIDIGADINAAPCGETPLIASVTKPEIMKLLLKSGADIHIENRFGKNVLFYAVQFGNLETVKILLENGGVSIINSQIYDKDRIAESIDVWSSFYPYPTEISNFTPLVYAKRYASKEIIDLLVEFGAKEGPSDPKKIQEWIDLGPLDL